MPVPFCNVTVTVTPVKQASLPDNTLDNPAKVLSGQVTGIPAYLEEMTASEAWASYNVELKNPAVLQMDIAYALQFDPEQNNLFPDAEVLVTASRGSGSYVGRIYAIHGRGDYHDDGLIADHAMFMLDRKTYPLR